MLHTLSCEQLLKTDLKTAWNFISDPRNLAFITPEYMKFTVLNDPGPEMYPGQIIEYTVSPILGIPLNWVTEITHVKELSYFVDEQRFGPYSFWHHQHHLLPVENGVLMRDIVHYKAPLGLLGRLANRVLIKNQLETIFAFRKKTFDRLYNAK